MWNRYDIDLLNDINNSIDLCEYVGQSTELRQVGGEYFAHCKFHKDDTPSLAINPNGNFFHCFSCGRSGRFIGYLMKYEGFTFDEAVEKGCKLSGIDINSLCKSESVNYLKEFSRLQKSNKKKITHKVLDKSILQEYSKDYPDEWLQEGITKEAMDVFDIRIDMLHNRIVYPVYDITGALINIKGRTRYENYKELKIPKYINYFKVGIMDYFQCLNVTIPFIKEKNEVIIFESIKSVMKAYGWGYKNCVSAEKHTLTKEQINLLVALRVNIVFAYDSDVDYSSEDVAKSTRLLKRVTNVYIIHDRDKLLGGAETKNAPVDLSKEIWDKLYDEKRKVRG